MNDSDTKSSAERISASPIDGSNRRRNLAAIVGLLVLIAVSGTFWMRLRDRLVIPPQASGTYAGAIKFNDGTQLPVFIDVDNLFVYGSLLGTRSTLQKRSRKETEPFVLQGDGAIVVLRGQLNEYNELVGTAEENGKKNGRFTLTHRTDPISLSKSGQRDAQSWVLLQAEHKAWDEKLSAIESIRKEKNEEIERLKNFLNDKPRLRAGADQKFAQVEAQLQAARDELSNRKEKAQKLAASLALAQRVTPFGRLVTLARESNERELRWIESMLRSGDRVGPTGIETEVKRGLEILGIKDQIERERKRILELGGDPDA